MKRLVPGLVLLVLLAGGFAVVKVLSARDRSGTVEFVPPPRIVHEDAGTGQRQAVGASRGDARPAGEGAAPLGAMGEKGPADASVDPSDAEWIALNREALEDLEAGRLEPAVDKLRRCCEEAFDRQVFCANFAEALARLARRRYDAALDDEGREEAIALLARAVELAPERKDLLRRLERWRKVQATEEDFWRDSSEHFELVYDGDRSALLQSAFELTDQLEALYLEFGELFAHFPVEEGRPKIRVVLYDKQEFDDITGLGHWAGGVFDGVVRIPLEDLSAERGKLARTLRHELVHAFVREVGGTSVPGWLNEGLAQWLEWRPISVRDRIVERAERRMAGHAPFPLERLQRSLSSIKKKDEILRAYSQALVLTRDIVEQFGERPLYGMIEGCRRGESCEDSFLRLTGSSLASFVDHMGR